MVIDEGLASELWPNDDPIGQCVMLARIQCVEVVGMSEARRHLGLKQSVQEFFCTAGSSSSLHSGSCAASASLAASRIDEGCGVALLRSVIDTGESPYMTIQPLAELADLQTRSWRLGATLFSLYAGISAARAP
jgi:hypothetical protein